MNRDLRPLQTPRGFTRFYAPLAATSLLLTATNPLLTSAISRSIDPLPVLAGFTVAFALCGVIYSPLLVIQQVAATRLLEGGDLAPIRRFAAISGLVFSLVAAAVAFSETISGLVFRELIGLSPISAWEATAAMKWLWPVPFITAERALHQGRLVAGHRTRPIAVGTGARTGVLAVVAFTLAAFTGGAWVGAAAFTAGLLVEAVLVGLSPTDGIETSRAEPGGEPEELTELLVFSSPLMLNVMLWWATPLVINAFLARGPAADLHVAAFGIVEALAWFIASPVGQLQHCSIALVESVDCHKRVRPLAGGVAVISFLILGLIAVPIVSGPVLDLLYDAGPEVHVSAAAALPLAALYPILYGHRQYYQGLFIRSNHTWTVGGGAVLRIAAIVLAAGVLQESFGDRGALFGVGLAVWGLFVEGVFLERLSGRQAIPALGTGVSDIVGEAISSSTEGGLA